MLPYILLLVISFLFCFVAKTREKRKIFIGSGELISENNFAVLVFFLMLWFLLACRSIDIGKDTENYKYFFITQSNQPLTQIFNGNIEPLFIALNWLIGQLTKNFQIYLAIIGAITVIPIAVLYNQDKRHSYLKIILFVNMSVFVILFSGIRQAIAMSIGLIAFRFVKKKKLIFFLITVFIAIGVHTSAFMLFAMYPLYYFKLKKKHLYVIVPVIAIVYIFNRPIFMGLLNIMMLFNTRYDDYVSLGNTGAVTMIICFAAFTLFAYIIPDTQKVDDNFIGMRNYLLLATLLQCFAPLHALAMRMNYYYILFVPVVVSMALNYVDNRWKQIAKVAEIVMCVFFTLYFLFTVYTGSLTDGGALNTYPYIPFWAD